MMMIEPIIKWFKTPKTLQGIAGMIVIVIVLALDFAYWAGAIAVETDTLEQTGEEPEEVTEWMEEVTYHFEQEDTIYAPGFGFVNNEYTSKQYDFPVEENASKAEIITTHTGSHPSPDIDLYIIGPDGEEFTYSADTSAEEGVKLDEKDFEKHGYGMYTADVRNFRGVAVTYKITIDVYSKVPANETSENGD